MNFEDLKGDELKKTLSADAARVIYKHKRKNNTVSFDVEVLKGKHTLNIRGVYARDGGILSLALQKGSRFLNFTAPFYFEDILQQMKELLK